MSKSDVPPRAAGGELVIPALAFAFTIYYLISIQDAPWTAKVSTYLIGGVLIGLALLFTVRVILARRAGTASLSFAGIAEPLSLVPRRLALLLLTLGYIAGLEWGGFTLTTFLFLLMAMLLLGGLRIAKLAVILSLLYALGGYLLFIAAFETRFPVGPFERLMKGLLPDLNG